MTMRKLLASALLAIAGLFASLASVAPSPALAALIYADRVVETTTTSGTGTYTLNGAAQGYQSFAAVGNGNTAYYEIFDGTNWEVGLGTYSTSGPTLARTTILASTNANAAVSWTSVVKYISLVQPAAVSQGLANGFVTTVNGVGCTLGSTCTVTAAPSGTAGGDLSGTYPNPTVAKINGNSVTGVTGTGSTLVLSAGPTLSGTVNLSGLTASQYVATDGSKNLVSHLGARLSQQPSNPGGVSGVTYLMQGLGATCHITPSFTGRLSFEVNGNLTTTSGTGNAALFFGTGTAPSNGAALTGSQITSNVSSSPPFGSVPEPFSLGANRDALTVGTAYWFDLAVANNGAGTASVSNLTCNSIEF